MEQKRPLEFPGDNPDPTENKRRTLSSFIPDNIVSKLLEPILRNVVREEVDSAVLRCNRFLDRSSSLKLEAPEASSSTMSLRFRRKLFSPIFTGSKIEDIDNNPLELLLVDVDSGKIVPTSLTFPVKVEITVMNGDFPAEGQDDWTAEEFERNIVREREGKRPLISGDVIVALRDGIARIGEISLTDNSSWIRSRKFRLGARIVGDCSKVPRIKEAITEAFVVKDHRGESYKKHHPPSLKDQVWRLEKIGKDGVFHKRMANAGIHTIQDLLKLWILDAACLRKILGVGMSDKMWESTIRHAQTCVFENKYYLYEAEHCSIYFNSICQVVKTDFHGPHPPNYMEYVKQLAWDAYRRWDTLQEVDGSMIVDNTRAKEPAF